MSYFSRFPNVYVAEGVTTDQSYRYRLVKNIFRRVEIREGLAKYTNNWERAQIPEGLKPCDVAQSLFDDPFMDWIILLSYLYAAAPNILAIISYQLGLNSKQRVLNSKIDQYSKRYGIFSYLMFVLIIIIISVSNVPENTIEALSWAMIR